MRRLSAVEFPALEFIGRFPDLNERSEWWFTAKFSRAIPASSGPRVADRKDGWMRRSIERV